MYFQYCNTLLLDELTIIIIIIAIIDVDNTLEMYFWATLKYMYAGRVHGDDPGDQFVGFFQIFISRKYIYVHVISY
jgi:hypothetical protein